MKQTKSRRILALLLSLVMLVSLLPLQAFSEAELTEQAETIMEQTMETDVSDEMTESDDPAADEDEQTRRNVVEVLLFHGAQSCASCKAIERATDELLEEYEDAIERGDVLYSKLDLIDHQARAEKYGVIWSSLLVIDYDNEGNEEVTDLTDHAYTDVMTDSYRLKTRLRTTIDNYLTE